MLDFLSSNAGLAVGGAIGGALVTRLFQFLTHRSNASEARIDGLLERLGSTNAKLELMAEQMGKLEGKVENLEEHRDELIAENKSLRATIEEQRIELVKRDLTIASNTDTIAALYADLERVQAELAGKKAATSSEVHPK